MYNAILQYVPHEWEATSTSMTKAIVHKETEEYKQIEYEVSQAVRNFSGIHRLVRIQDVYIYGQFLLREQLLAVSSPGRYYKVRRYISLHKSYKDTALKYNLDPRRCSMNIVKLHKTLTMQHNDVVFVIQVLTDKPNDDLIIPNNSLEYFIEYVVEL